MCITRLIPEPDIKNSGRGFAGVFLLPDVIKYHKKAMCHNNHLTHRFFIAFYFWKFLIKMEGLIRK